MPGIDISVTIGATPTEVWSVVEDVAGHVEWMADATEIRFLTDERSGVGVRFECDTKVGPLTTTDVMEITEWEPEQSMGVRHSGAVTGEGRFELEAVEPDHTIFRWSEDLSFPWYFGGPLGEFAAKPVLEWVWRRNLTRLAGIVEERFPRA
ncbi:MAG: SRPBCC family protein [Acidimicrobiales bacterium]